MATASSFSINVKETGVFLTIPDNDVARMMYYLHCVTVGVGLDILVDDLVDFRNYHRLSPQRIGVVLKSALEFSPDVFLNQLIFLDDEGEVVPANSRNEFVTISTACNLVHVQRNFAIGGQVKDVTTVMFYKTSWLDYFYTGPIGRTLGVTLHCAHCTGNSGLCSCDECPRFPSSQCQSLMNVLSDVLSSTSLSPPIEPTRAAPAPSPTSHLCNCDGCGKRNFEGLRYRCEDCEDFDLCHDCYTAKRHNLSHRFMQIVRPGSKPTRLPPRVSPSPGVQPLPPISCAPKVNPVATGVKNATAHACNCDGCGWQFIDGQRYKCETCDDFDLCKDCYTANRHSLEHQFMLINRPESIAIRLASRASLSVPTSPPPRRPAPPPPRSSRSPAPPLPPKRSPAPVPHSNPNPPPYSSAASHTVASPEFYYRMKVPELKDFLTENGVDHEDASDKETLSRLAWETYCDSMTVLELNTYLADNNIPAHDCRNIANRREKAKQAFKIPPPEAEATPTMVGGQICENDIVVLTGLSRPDMNGRQAKVLQADCGGGRAEVHVEELGKAFKVKLENLVPLLIPAQDDDFLD